jgi:hypothetical protein
MHGFRTDTEIGDVSEMIRPPRPRALPERRLEARRRLLLASIAGDTPPRAAERLHRSRVRRLVNWLGSLAAVGLLAVGVAHADPSSGTHHDGVAVEAAAVIGAGAAVALHGSAARRAVDRQLVLVRASTRSAVAA